MGIHVARGSRGIGRVLYTRRAGEDKRPHPARPTKGGGSQSSKSPKGELTGGTRGDFGADFE